MSYHTGIALGMVPKEGEYKSCLPDHPTICLEGWTPACDFVNAIRLGPKSGMYYGAPYLYPDKCGAGQAYAFVIWWVYAVYGNKTNSTLYQQYPGDPPPKDKNWPKQYYEIPAMPGVQNVPIARTMVIAMSIMATLMQQERKKRITDRYAMLRALVGLNMQGKGSIQELFTKVAPKILRNNDDAAGCELNYTKSLAESKQYMFALPNETKPITWSTPPGATYSYKPAPPYTGYCRPEMVMKVNSQGEIYGECAVHPECRINEYGSIVPAQAPPKPDTSKILMVLSTLQNSPFVRGQITAEQSSNVASEAQKEPAEQAKAEAKKRMSGPMLAAGILAVGAVGIAGYAFLKGKR
ncbi:MAG: hypothetical protein GX886_10570 [Comamonadaceae bacterium]|nr:hypothetical protein [Comamonadaceae bacterium]